MRVQYVAQKQYGLVIAPACSLDIPSLPVYAGRGRAGVPGACAHIPLTDPRIPEHTHAETPNA